MKKRDAQDYLNDIRETISDIQSFTSGLDFAGFKKNDRSNTIDERKNVRQPDCDVIPDPLSEHLKQI